MMNRRDLLKIAGLTGLSFAAEPFASSLKFSKTAFAEGQTPLFLSVHAGGGWDPTSFCDPKGRISDTQADPVNRYMLDDIRSPSASSPIRWAPMGQNETFFQAHYDKLLVLNGVDTSTNNHSTGTRYLNSGQLEEGHPSFAAMLTANIGANLPLGYITNGGYDITRGVVPRTRLGSLGVIAKIAEPDLDGDRLFHAESVNARMDEFRSSRLERLRGRVRLPKITQSLDDVFLSRSGQNELKRLNENLPDLDLFSTSLGQQGAIALAGYRSGLTVAANLSVGGFDTHGNHDVAQAAALDRLSSGLMEIWAEVERHGLEDRVVIMVNSDFGRTPRYNEGNGKDHWSITSVFFMGGGIQGNRVIGATDEGVNALPINLQSLELDPNGVKMTPAHIHASLRQHFGIDQSPLSAHYPVQEQALNLFS
jgi:hypothetical protein